MPKFPTVSLGVPLESNGAVPINIQDQHTQSLDLDFIQAQGVPTTITVEASPEDTQITVSDTTGFIAGNIVGLFTSTGQFYFGTQLGAPVGSVINLDTPIDKTFPIGSACITATSNMNVNGSATRQIFQIGPVGVGTSISVDITRIMGYLQDDVVMDDSDFGGLSALTNGIILRLNNGVINNLWNAKTNGRLSLIGFDFNYTEKAPAGSYGARFRITYAGQDKHGVTLRLAPGDTLELIIQDDLTGLEAFNMMAQGHIVTD